MCSLTLLISLAAPSVARLVGVLGAISSAVLLGSDAVLLADVLCSGSSGAVTRSP